MKKLFIFLTMLVLGIVSSWADGVSDFMSDSYANAKWLSITNCNDKNYVMFATSSTMETRAKGSTNYAANQQIAFVGTKSSFKIYSYSQGSNKALKAASDNPGDGTTVSWDDPSAASTWVLEETYASDETDPGYGICLKGKTGKSLNLYGGNGPCKFYNFTGDKASRWTISKTSNLVVEDGKVYKISSHQNSGSNYQIINSATANQVINTGDEKATNQGYWLCHKDHAVYTFESAMADGKYIGWKELSTTAEEYYLNFATATNNTTCISLYRKDDSTSRYLYVHKNVSSGTNGWNQNSSGAFADGGSTDYIFEEVTGVSVYTVVSNIKNGGVTYTPSYTGTATQTKDGFYVFASAPSASDFMAISVTNYTPGAVTIDTSAKTITVNYTATITYTLTDVNGATYSWSASGTYGTAPTITGCAGSTISNEVWSEESRTYTADITFPFPISSNSVTNWCYINIFDAKQYYKIANGHWFYLHASGDKVIAHDKDEPTNESGKIDEYKWAMIPAINNGAITFIIKNAVANKFIYHDDTETYSYHTGIKLGDTGVAVTYVKDASADKYYLYIPSVSKYISANSVTGGTNQRVGAYGSVHDGESVAFYEPTNFSTLMANLKTAYTSFNQYILPFNSGTYTETVEGKMMETFATYNLTTTNVIKDNPTAYLTASDFQEYTNAYNTAINGLQASIDENTFIRIRSMMSSDLINTPTYLSSEDKIIGGYHNCMFTQDNKKLTGKETIFYYDSDKHIIAFSNGNWLFDDAGYAEWNTKINHNKLNAEFDNVNIKFLHNSNNRYVYTKSDANGIYLDTDASINSHEHNFLIEPVTSLPVTFNKAALGYATFFTPVELKIPENTHAYVCKLNGNKLTFFEITNVLDHDDEKAIPANTAVLLYNSTIKENANDEVVVNFPITLCDYVIAENSFHETLAAEAFDPDDQNTDTYSLRTYTENEATKIGFFKKTTGTYLAGFKAWLQTPHQASGARNLTIYFDGEGDPTGIVEALGLQNENVDIYDLNGRKLSSYKKGINIVNGKKVMVQ